MKCRIRKSTRFGSGGFLVINTENGKVVSQQPNRGKARRWVKKHGGELK